MSDQDIDQILKAYVRQHFSPKEEERKYVSKKYDELDGFLGSQCFQSGSFARFTAIHPLHDLDVIWVTSQTDLMDDPKVIMRRLADNLHSEYKENGEEVPEISQQTHSVTLLFKRSDGEFSIDVVPAAISLESDLANDYGDPIYIVPEIQKMGRARRAVIESDHSRNVAWIYSDPKGYITLATEVDKQSNGNFRKTTKLLKAWRYGQKSLLGDQFKLKSFHIELVCLDLFIKDPRMSVYEALRTSLGELTDYIIDAPCIKDRAYEVTGEDKYIDEYLKDDQESKALIIQQIQLANGLVSKLAACENEKAVKDVIDKLSSGSKSVKTETLNRVEVRTPPPAQWSDGQRV